MQNCSDLLTLYCVQMDVFCEIGMNRKKVSALSQTLSAEYKMQERTRQRKLFFNVCQYLLCQTSPNYMQQEKKPLLSYRFCCFRLKKRTDISSSTTLTIFAASSKLSQARIRNWLSAIKALASSTLVPTTKCYPVNSHYIRIK